MRYRPLQTTTDLELSTVAAHAVASTDWKAISIDGSLVTPEALVDAWASSSSYALDAVVMSGRGEVCMYRHTSSNGRGDQPGVGASWDTYWTRKGTLHYAWDGTKVLMTDRKLGWMDIQEHWIWCLTLTSRPCNRVPAGSSQVHGSQGNLVYSTGGERMASVAATSAHDTRESVSESDTSRHSSTLGGGLAYQE